jgi:radical SAM superfamily enzyme YgiQ (UPF0313 family)
VAGKAIPGLVARVDGEIRMDSPEVAQDLDALGMPAWDLLEPETYPQAPVAGFARKFPVAPLLLTRGCPWRCKFCAAHVVHQRRVRKRSVEGVLEEIRYLQDRHSIQEFLFIDDHFAVNREHTLRLCRALEKRTPPVLWSVPQGIRLDAVDREVAESLVRAGCYRVLAGLESGSPDILEAMRKDISLEETEKKLCLLHEAGLRVGGNFIIGYPGERPEDVRATIRFARRLPLDYCSFTAFVPYPGSEIFEELIRKGELSLDDLPGSDMYVVERSYSPYLSVKEIKRFRLSAYLSFFLRPHPLSHFFREVRSRGHLGMILRRAWTHFRHLLPTPKNSD